MNCYNEVCPQLANASRVLGNLGDDILSKITLKSGVGTIVETGSDDYNLQPLLLKRQRELSPKRLHFFKGYCAATSPAARSTPLRSARA